MLVLGGERKPCKRLLERVLAPGVSRTGAGVPRSGIGVAAGDAIFGAAAGTGLVGLFKAAGIRAGSGGCSIL